MKHEMILKQLVAEAGKDANVLGLLVFGSVATNTHRENSDIDLITIFQMNKPTSGIDNSYIEGIKVGTIFFTYAILLHSIKTVPYLLHPLGGAKLLIDREDTIRPILEEIQIYFANHPEIENEWHNYYQQLKEEKAQFGYEKTTIIDVWNELENRYSGGKTKREFFNAFYLTNPRIFSVLKRFL